MGDQGLRTLSVVAPAFNEEERLPGFLDSVAGPGADAVAATGMELAEVLVVDDGSTDRSREIVRARAQSCPFVRPVVEYDSNRGKGAAVAAGVRSAAGEWILIVDIDLSTPLEELGKLVRAVEAGADVAVGSRRVSGSEVVRGPLHRQLTGWTFSKTVHLLTGLSIHDTQNGFKLLPARLARLLFEEQRCPGFAFDVEILMRAARIGASVTEVPVLYVHDSRSRVQVASASLRMLEEVRRLSDLRPGSAPADNADRDAGWEANAAPDQSRLEPHRDRQRAVEGGGGAA